MRLLFVADGRSPIALNWIAHFVETGHEVHLLSTFPCQPALALSSLTVVPVAFSGAGEAAAQAARPAGGAASIRLRSGIRHWLGPLTVPAAARQARRAIEAIGPDLVHALRIPFEGMLAASANPGLPLLLSVWGNDFTLHAASSPGMAMLTGRTLPKGDALLTDCRRDLRLAHFWGFPASRPAAVLPGNGGIRPEIFARGDSLPGPLSPDVQAVLASIPAGQPVVVNPRGFRAYVRSDTFFRSIPGILAAHPATVFLCPAMAGEPLANRWLTRLGIGQAVRLLPRLTPTEMAAVMRRAQVVVSPSLHDGTPNTLLEAMACGCFPVAGDLESIREWIDDGVNGILIDPRSPDELAPAVGRALDAPDLRERAAVHNARLIAERATYDKVMAEAEAFYRRVIDSRVGRLSSYSPMSR